MHVPILVPIFSAHAWFGRNSCFERIVYTGLERFRGTVAKRLPFWVSVV